MRQHLASLIIVSLGILGSQGMAQQPATRSSPFGGADFTKRQQAMAANLKTNKPDQVTAAFTDLRKWFDEKPEFGEHALYMCRAALVGATDHADELLEMIELSKKVVLATKTKRVGYLLAMQAGVLAGQQKTDEAMNVLKQALASADKETAAVDIVNILPKILLAQKRQDVVLEMMTQVIISVANTPAVVEAALKERMTILVLQNKLAEALVDAKSLYNVCTLEHTADALTLIDKHLKLAYASDPSVEAQFKKEQAEGGVVPEGGAKARKSDVLLGIKGGNPEYEEALKKLEDNDFDGLMYHAALLLVADHPADAAGKAEQAYVLAKDDGQTKAAQEMVARCYKAEDGTVGRAKGWLKGQAGMPNQ